MEPKELQGNDVGEVDMFGLNEFGQPEGLNQAWGAAAGAAISTGAAIAVRSLAPSMKGKSELIGMGIGVASGAAMVAFPGSRAAGWACIASSAVGGGLRVLEQLFSSNAPMSFEGVEIVKVPTLSGVVMENMPILHGNAGLGLTTMQQVPTLSGAMPQLVGAMPQLVGAGQRQQQVTLEGGPTISGLAGHYGATLFGTGN